MSRKFLDNVRAEIITLFADNTIGAITAASLRQVCTDTIDSVTNDEAVLNSSVPTLAVPISAAWTTLLVFDGQIGGDGSFLIPSFATGTITGTATAGFTYQGTGFVNANIPNTEVLEFALGVNGVPLGFINTIEGIPGDDPQSAILFGYNLSAGVSDVYSLLVRSNTGVTSLDVNDAEMTITIQPTNNP